MRAGRTTIYQKTLRTAAWSALFLPALVGCKSPGQLTAIGVKDDRLAGAESSPAAKPITQVAFDEQSADAEPDGAVAENDAGMIAESISTQVHQPNSLSNFESLALHNHPAILQARAQVDAARGQYVQAGLPFNPVLQYQSQEIGNSGSSGLHQVQLSQQFVTANKLGLAQHVAAQSLARRRAELERAELQVLTRVRVAFVQALIAQQRVELTNQIVELAERSVGTSAQLLQAQEVSRVGLLQAQVEAQQAHIEAENTAAISAASRRALAASVGIDELDASPLSGDVADGLTDAPWDSLLENIVANSPDLAAAGSDFQRARWALQLACAQVTPNVTGAFAVGVDAGTDDTYATVGVSMPLPIRNRNQGSIRAARAQVTSTLAASENVQLNLERRLADAVGRYRSARQRFLRLRDQTVPMAEETFELSEVAFEAGELNYLQFLTAQRTLVTTKLRVLDALEQAKQAWAEIEGLLVSLQ